MLGVLLLALVVYRFWCDVPVQNPERLADIRSEIDSYAQQARSLRKEQNGWYDLAPLLTAKPGPPLEPFSRLAQLAPGRPHETTAELQNLLAGPEVAHAIAALPLGPLDEALARPVLVWAGDTLNPLQDSPPNLQSLRQVVRALVLLGVTREKAGKPREALLSYLAALRLACCFSGEVSLDAQIQVAGMSESPLERLLELLRRQALDAGDCRRVEFTLQRLDLHPTGYTRCLDRELVVGLRALEALQEENPVPWLGSWYFVREQSVLANWHLSRRPALERLDPVAGNPEEFRREHPWDAGAVLFIPAYGNSALLQRVALTRIQAGLVAARLELYRLQHKTYPASLAPLTPPARNYLVPNFGYRRVSAREYELDWGRGTAEK